MSILEILEAHRPTAEHYCGACPQWTPPDEDLDAVHSMNDVDWFMREHLAQMLEQHVQSERRAAWFDGQKAGWEEAKDPGAFVNDYHDAQTTCPY